MAGQKRAEGLTAAERARERRALRRAKSPSQNEDEPEAPPSPKPPPARAGDRGKERNPYAAPATSEPSPEPSRRTYDLAGRATRFMARVLDGAVLLPAIALVYAAAGVSGDRMVMTAAAFVAMIGTTGYQAWLVATTGQSIGKKLLGIKVVLQDGSPPGWVHGVVLRELVPTVLGVVPAIGTLFSLANALAIFGEGRRCLHDRIAGTEVVRVR